MRSVNLERWRIAGPLAARCGGQICGPFVLGFYSAERGRIAFNAERCISHGNSVRLSLYPSVRLSVTALGDPPPSEKRRLRPISDYNVSTINAREKSSIIANRKSTTRFPTSYRPRWSPYVTPKSLKEWLKSKFVLFANENQLKSNKLCYKVSLC